MAMSGVSPTARRSGARGGCRVIRHPVARAGLGLVAGFIGSFAVIQAIDRLGEVGPSGTSIVLGVPDLSGYCSRESDALLPLLVVPNPYGWECAGPISNVWTSTVIDVDAVCQWQHGERARARLVDPDRPEGWRCVTDAPGLSQSSSENAA